MLHRQLEDGGDAERCGGEKNASGDSAWGADGYADSSGLGGVGGVGVGHGDESMRGRGDDDVGRGELSHFRDHEDGDAGGDPDEVEPADVEVETKCIAAEYHDVGGADNRVQSRQHSQEGCGVALATPAQDEEDHDASRRSASAQNATQNTDQKKAREVVAVVIRALLRYPSPRFALIHSTLRCNQDKEKREKETIMSTWNRVMPACFSSW